MKKLAVVMFLLVSTAWADKTVLFTGTVVGVTGGNGRPFNVTMTDGAVTRSFDFTAEKSSPVLNGKVMKAVHQDFEIVLVDPDAVSSVQPPVVPPSPRRFSFRRGVVVGDRNPPPAVNSSSRVEEEPVDQFSNVRNVVPVLPYNRRPLLMGARKSGMLVQSQPIFLRPEVCPYCSKHFNLTQPLTTACMSCWAPGVDGTGKHYEEQVTYKCGDTFIFTRRHDGSWTQKRGRMARGWSKPGAAVGLPPMATTNDVVLP